VTGADHGGAVYSCTPPGKSGTMEDEDRKVAKVPITLGAIMGIFLVVAAVVVILIWAI